MGIKPKGPLFLLHEVGRTEALLCAHRKACNRRPVWKTALLTTNLFSGGILINVFIKATGFDASTILITSFESSSWRHCVFWKYYWLSSIDRCIWPFPCPRKKSTSHMCPITKLLLFKCHATFILPKWLRCNSEFFYYIPLNVKFLSLRKI